MSDVLKSWPMLSRIEGNDARSVLPEEHVCRVAEGPGAGAGAGPICGKLAGTGLVIASYICKLQAKNSGLETFPGETLAGRGLKSFLNCAD